MIRFEDNIMLVYKVFNNVYSSCQGLKDDLIQEGMMGLWKACETFDETRGLAFSTYAVVCIRNQMGMFMRKENKYYSRVESLDRCIDETKSEDTLLDIVVEDKNPRETATMLHDAIEELDRIGCKEVLEMKLTGMSQKEIAKKLQVSEALVSERINYAYRALKEIL